MAKCIYCGADTCMYVSEAPVCVRCSDEVDAGRKPPAPAREEPPPKSDDTRTNNVLGGDVAWQERVRGRSPTPDAASTVPLHLGSHRGTRPTCLVL